MRGFHVVLALLVVVGVLAPLARKIDVPDAIVFVVGGIACPSYPRSAPSSSTPTSSS